MEEALDLSFDRLLMMMMMVKHTTGMAHLKKKNCISKFFGAFRAIIIEINK